MPIGFFIFGLCGANGPPDGWSQNRAWNRGLLAVYPRCSFFACLLGVIDDFFGGVYARLCGTLVPEQIRIVRIALQPTSTQSLKTPKQI